MSSEEGKTNLTTKIGSRTMPRNEVFTGGSFWRDKVFSHNFVRTTYNRVIRRNSAYMGAVLVGAFAFEAFTNGFSTWLWNRMNQGKSFEDIMARKLQEEKARLIKEKSGK